MSTSSAEEALAITKRDPALDDAVADTERQLGFAPAGQSDGKWRGGGAEAEGRRLAAKTAGPERDAALGHLGGDAGAAKPTRGQGWTTLQPRGTYRYRSPGGPV